MAKKLSLEEILSFSKEDFEKHIETLSENEVDEFIAYCKEYKKEIIEKKEYYESIVDYFENGYNSVAGKN